jgi:hypothetical protein
MLLGGVFWKNPLVRGDQEFMWSVLSKLSMESLFMLLPHLEEWVLQHAVPVQKDRACSYISREFEFCRDGRFDSFGRSSRVVFENRHWKGPNDMTVGIVVGIKGLHKGWEYRSGLDYHSKYKYWQTKAARREYAVLQKVANRGLISECSVWGELEKTEADWWLFTFNHGRTQSLAIVDYRGKRMWGTMCEDKMCYWDDVWELKTWRLGENDAFTKDWFRSGYDNLYESPIDSVEVISFRLRCGDGLF